MLYRRSHVQGNGLLSSLKDQACNQGSQVLSLLPVGRSALLQAEASEAPFLLARPSAEGPSSSRP